MEKERIALLTEVKKKNNKAVVKEKMLLTYTYRRWQEWFLIYKAGGLRCSQKMKFH